MATVTATSRILKEVPRGDVELKFGDAVDRFEETYQALDHQRRIVGPPPDCSESDHYQRAIQAHSDATLALYFAINDALTGAGQPALGLECGDILYIPRGPHQTGGTYEVVRIDRRAQLVTLDPSVVRDGADCDFM